MTSPRSESKCERCNRPFRAKWMWNSCTRCGDRLCDKCNPNGDYCIQCTKEIAEEESKKCPCIDGWLMPLDVEEPGVPCPHCNPEGKR